LLRRHDDAIAPHDILGLASKLDLDGAEELLRVLSPRPMTLGGLGLAPGFTGR
jgi:hypothetical protein